MRRRCRVLEAGAPQSTTGASSDGKVMEFITAWPPL